MKMKSLILLCVFMALQFSLRAQNWSQDVAPILYDHCTKCHHPGGIGPSSYMTYSDAYNNSASILSAITTGYMPPYPANTSYRHFMNENVLTDAEKSTLQNWVSGGSVSGDLATAPTPPTYGTTSELNQVDFSGTTPLNTSLATTHDYYRTFVLSPNYSVDQFIDGIEIIPGNSNIVHHVVIYYDPTDDCLALDGSDGLPGFTTNGTGGGIPNNAYFVGAWVPGKGPQFLPFGFGIRATAGGHFLVEMHYPAGTNGQEDQTIVNIQHSQDPTPREAWYNPIITHDPATLDEPALIIPANTVQTFHATYTIPSNVSLIGIFPHMHLIGRSIKSFATAASDTIPLIDIPAWNFRWQLGYDYPQLIKLPTSSHLKAVATYDNTANNPFQPNNPPQLVMWGEETSDEMLVIFYLYSYYVAGDENLVVQHNTANDVENIVPADAWNFYPNPSNGELNWSSFVSRFGKQNIQIFDLAGKLIFQQNLMVNGGVDFGTLHLSHLPKGMYEVVVKNVDQQSVYQTRIVLQ